MGLEHSCCSLFLLNSTNKQVTDSSYPYIWLHFTFIRNQSKPAPKMANISSLKFLLEMDPHLFNVHEHFRDLHRTMLILHRI